MDYIQQLIERYPALERARPDIEKSIEIIRYSYENGGKLLIAGNGGSASDAEHISGELMKNFLKKRKLPGAFVNDLEKIDKDISGYLLSRLQPGLPAISLCGQVSLSTACANDIDGNIAFAQQVYGYGKEGDAFLGISTSGNAKNIIYAAAVARIKKMKIIALTGESGGELKQYADICIRVPETETWKIQESHLPVYHAICMTLEEYFF